MAGIPVHPSRQSGRVARRILDLWLGSPDFENGDPIPSRFTAAGMNVPPALAWSGLPEGTASLALLYEDPLGPRGTPFVLWVLFNVPPTLSIIPEGLSKGSRPHELQGGIQGVNDLGNSGYDAPAPPVGHPPHLYEFQLFALDQMLKLPSHATGMDLRRAMEGHQVGIGRMVATSRR